MEWVVTTGRSTEEAKSRALDQLGVAEDDAEFEVLEEPRAGLFGRVRGEARVRARVRPTQPRPKMDRRDRRKKSDGEVAAGADDAPRATPSTGRPTRKDAAAPRAPAPARARAGRPPSRAAASAEGGDGSNPPVAVDVIDAGATNGSARGGAVAGDGDRGETRHRGGRGRGRGSDVRREANDERQETDVDAAQVGEEARKFMEGLVDAFGLSGSTSVRRDGDDLEVAVEGSDLGLLVGPRGVTLQAVQELARVASQRRLGDHDTRLRVDVAGYRERRREALTRFASQVADEVVSSGTARSLEPMSSADRKVIHDALSDHDGVVTRSEGDDPARRVVIAPANG